MTHPASLLHATHMLLDNQISSSFILKHKYILNLCGWYVVIS